MYLDFYNLKKEPFRNSPDPEFLFLSPSHREALASILYGVEHRKGFITIIGEVGLGKTSILRYYLEQVVKENLETIYLFNPTLSFSGLMKNILREQGFSPGAEGPAELVNKFHHILIDRFKQGRNVVLIIDEAQNMPVETLESLRMLSNLETSKEKLLQIVLVGQPELEDKLRLRELRQLRQRIAIKTTIAPLSKKESFQYIKHRLATASHDGPAVFTQWALKMIIAESRGVPRLINILCDNALITGFGYQKKSITPGIVWEVINDFKGKKIAAFEMGLLVSTVVLLLVTGVILVVLFRDHAFSPVTTLVTQPALQGNGGTPDNERGDVLRKVQLVENSGQGSPLAKTLASESGQVPIPIIKTVKKIGHGKSPKSVRKKNPGSAKSTPVWTEQKIALSPGSLSPEDK